MCRIKRDFLYCKRTYYYLKELLVDEYGDIVTLLSMHKSKYGKCIMRFKELSETALKIWNQLAYNSYLCIDNTTSSICLHASQLKKYENEAALYGWSRKYKKIGSVTTHAITAPKVSGSL